MQCMDKGAEKNVILKKSNPKGLFTPHLTNILDISGSEEEGKELILSWVEKNCEAGHGG